MFADPVQPLFQRIRGDWPAMLIANPALPRPPSFSADLIPLKRAFLANLDPAERSRRSAPLNPMRPEPWDEGGSSVRPATRCRPPPRGKSTMRS
ncbi:hypothetical protein [Nonomuraea sp. NPDC050786]|uniref:hypothetical protein n=1 Tax=Nonomuraea sp. NPDC050786 TaxID=3154840 RepID=UPI00340C6CC2